MYMHILRFCDRKLALSDAVKGQHRVIYKVEWVIFIQKVRSGESRAVLEEAKKQGTHENKKVTTR